MKYLRLNAPFAWLKSGASAGWGSLKNNLQRAVKKQFCWCVAAMTMSTPLWFTSVLLVLSLNVTNWLNSEKGISVLVTLVSLNDGAARWSAVKVISPIRMKPAYTALNTASMFRSLPSVGWCLVILTRISLVRGKQTAFVWGKDRLPPLMRGLSCGPSNACKGIVWSTWLARSNER